ncbi:MAG: class I SAM-dependent methyltransferase [Acidimicrobiales bacterium]
MRGPSELERDAAEREALSRVRLLGLYRGASRADRAQVWARWWTCPLPALEAEVPLRGRVLEVGCGRGLTLMSIVVGRPDREALGIDIDPEKVRVAADAVRRLGAGDGRATVEVLEAGALPDGGFDAIVFNDMLYLLPSPERCRLLADATERLAAGGCIVIKENDVRPRWKHLVNLAHNAVLRRLIGNLEGDTVDLWRPDAYRQVLEDLDLDVRVQRLDHGYPYAHWLLVARPLR